MRLTLAIAVAALMATSPASAQTAAPAPPPEPTSPNAAKSEDALSGKTPPKNERGGKEAQQGTETGWGGQWKVPEDDKSQSRRNEAEGPSVKQPVQGK